MTKHLLVLQPEPHETPLLAAALALPGLTVERVHTTEEVLSTLRTQRHAHVLLIAPQANPFEVLLKAKDVAPHTRALVCTTTEPVDTLPESPEKAVSVIRYLHLPDQLPLLESRVQTLRAPEAQERYALEAMELLDIIQLACLARTTAVLHLRYENRKGRIAFDQGHIAHAEFMAHTGSEALCDLVALRQGNMFLQVGAASETRSIDRPWQDLIREAAAALPARRARFDREDDAREEAITESDVSDLLQVAAAPSAFTTSGEIKGGASLFDAQDLEDLGALDHPDDLPAPAPSPRRPRTGTSPTQRPAATTPHDEPHLFRPPTPGNRAPVNTTAQSLQQLIQSFADEIPEFIATDLVHIHDGLSILGASSTPDYDSTTACAYYADLLRCALRAAEDYAPPEEMEDIQLATHNAYILVRTLRGTPYMHLLMMHRTGNLGIGRVTMRRFEPLFTQALNPPT